MVLSSPFSSSSAELIKDIIREREVKDDIERQLSQEQKLRGEFYQFLFSSELEVEEEQIGVKTQIPKR